MGVYATQAALCALSDGGAGASSSPSTPTAKDYAAIAVSAHQVVCGADIFHWRFQKEVESSVVPDSAKSSFWELVQQQGKRQDGHSSGRAWNWAISDAAWKFGELEVPEAFSGCD